MVGFQRLTKHIAWFSALLLTTVLMPADAAENFGPKDAKNLVAMVESRAGNQQQVGAGIILGRGPSGSDSVYVATAFHVAFPDGEMPDEVMTKFRFLPGETKRATVLNIRDMDLDYAVLKVEGIAPSLLDALAFDRVRSSVDLKTGDELYSMGNPGGVAWNVSPAPDGLFQRSSGGIIRFQSQAIQVGYSGGGLFTKDWYLVGMIRSDGSVESKALSMETLIAEVSYQGLEPDLKQQAKRGQLTTADETDSKQQVAKLETTVSEKNVATPVNKPNLGSIDITGTYTSILTSRSKTSRPEVVLTQSGNKITGVVTPDDGYGLEGIMEGNTIKFKRYYASYEVRGILKISDDGITLVGEVFGLPKSGTGPDFRAPETWVLTRHK
jgi:S1-C subfamily serine protease